MCEGNLPVEPEENHTLDLLMQRRRNSKGNSVNPENLINQLDINWGQFKDHLRYMGLAGTLVSTKSFTLIFLVTKFPSFSEMF